MQEIDEIFKIFRLLGTPNVETWPGVKELPDYKDCFPKWIAKPLHEVLPDKAAHDCQYLQSCPYCQCSLPDVQESGLLVRLCFESSHQSGGHCLVTAYPFKFCCAT